MQIGLLMFPSPTESANVGRMAEQFGFSSLVFTDSQCLAPEVWSQLMLVAAATEQIEIGTGVTNPVSRDPAVAASAALGLQVASGGRAVLGIGRGDSSMAKIGRRPAPPSEFDTYLENLRAYMDGREVDRDGTPSRIEWLDECDVPYIPIEVAATGPKVIEIAARRADRICFAVGADPERLSECIARARGCAESAGRDPKSLRFGAFINCVIHPDPEIACEAIRGGLSSFAHFSGFKGMNIEALPEGTREAARYLRSHYKMDDHAVGSGTHAQALKSDFVHRFGIAGPASEAITRLKEIREAGIDYVKVIPGSRDMSPDIGLASLQVLAEKVVPALAR